MADLERELRELRVSWPETPDLAEAVLPRLTARPPRSHAAGWAGRRRLALVVAASLVALFATVMAASPDARSSVLRWLGLKGVEIERGHPTATPAPPSRLGRSLGLGTPVTLEEARRRLSFRVLVPATLGRPDAVYLGQGRVALVYAPRSGLKASRVSGVGLLVEEFSRATVGMSLQKIVDAGGTVRRLTVNGAPAYWIAGAPHGFAYESPEGGGFERQRLADHTLLVQRSDVLLRVEGGVGQARAVAIAQSVQ